MRRTAPVAEPATSPAPLGVRAVLRIRNYRILWLGQLVSEAGDGLTNLALLLLVNALTGSTAALAGMAIVLAIPPLTIGLVAGTYADRIDRRRIMLASDLLRAVVVLGFISSAAPNTSGCCTSSRSLNRRSGRSSPRPAAL